MKRENVIGLRAFRACICLATCVCHCKSSLLAASEMRECVTKSGCRRGSVSRLAIMQIDPRFCFPSSHFFFFLLLSAKRQNVDRASSGSFILLSVCISSIDRLDHRYVIGFLTRPSSCPLASVYNYVWYCNIGAARFGWWAVFILRAEMLLLYHSSSADIPKTGKDGIFRQTNRAYISSLELRQLGLSGLTVSLSSVNLWVPCIERIVLLKYLKI